MSKIKGPAIPEDTFDIKGHCCGMRYTGISGLTDQGFDFELTEEARRYLADQGMELPGKVMATADDKAEEMDACENSEKVEDQS